LEIVRIGVLGGTFNPIHLGHLLAAQSVQSLFSLSRVHFVVASTPPHKRPEEIIPFDYRYAMVSLAVAGEISFIPSRIELEPAASPYTIDTMEKLARLENPCKLFFIAGSDSIREVASWRESEKLLTLYDFIFVKRAGDSSTEASLPADMRHKIRDLTGLTRAQIRRRIGAETEDERLIYIVDTKVPDISSTGIRRLAASGGMIRRMVPRPVGEYIRKLRLYGEER